MNRKYTMKRWGSRIIMNATTKPDWRTDFWRSVIKKGDLSTYISKSHEPIKQIARHMRIRPEAVFQIISDAFDKSLLERTVTIKDGCIHFECDIATITLDPGEDGLHWKLLYHAKEEMFNRDFSPHPDEAYTIPKSLYDGNVKLSFTRIEPLMRMISKDNISPSVGIFDVLDRHYSKALREGTIIQKGNELTFNPGFYSLNSKDIYITIAPDYHDPIPNLWHIIRIEES